MKKNYLLCGLLVIQAVAAYLFLSGGGELQGHAGIQKLLEFNREQIDEIRVEDSNGEIAELKRKDRTWLTIHDFPVEADRVNRLLDLLDELDHGLAVASSSSAAKRFEVSPDNFQRHLKLLKGGKIVVDFYLGTGAGARRNHVRLANQEMIHACTIGSYDLTAEIANWQDKDLLQVEMAEIQSVELDGLKIIRAQQSEAENAKDQEISRWFAEGLVGDEIFKADEFESQLRNLATLRYNRAFKDSIAGQGPEAEVTVSFGDSSRSYQFFKAKDGDNFWLKVSDFEELFEVTQYNGNRVVDNLMKEKLIEQPELELEESPAEEIAESHESTLEAESDKAEAIVDKE